MQTLLSANVESRKSHKQRFPSSPSPGVGLGPTLDFVIAVNPRYVNGQVKHYETKLQWRRRVTGRPLSEFVRS